jgi:anti-anti-sigma factor
MEITRTEADGKLTLAVSGKLSAATAEEFGEAVNAAIKDCSNLILDFKELTYLASAGIRVLMAAMKKLKATGGRLLLLNVNENIMEVFDIPAMQYSFFSPAIYFSHHGIHTEYHPLLFLLA